MVFIGCAHVTAALPPTGDGLHAGGAFTAGHPRPAAALLPLSGRASAACDEELRDSYQSPGQVRGQTRRRQRSRRSGLLSNQPYSPFFQVHPADDAAGQERKALLSRVDLRHREVHAHRVHPHGGPGLSAVRPGLQEAPVRVTCAICALPVSQCPNFLSLCSC